MGKLNFLYVNADLKIAITQFAASNYGQVQTNFNSTGQFQPIPQVHALTGSSSQSITTGPTLQSNGGGQPLVTTVMPSV